MPPSDLRSGLEPAAVGAAARSRPTLLSSCALAATAAEARFRITYPFQPRDSRVVAVDPASAPVVCRAGGLDWSGTARFLTFAEALPGSGNGATPGNGSAPDAILHTCEGTEVRLSDELDGADVTVMVATAQGAEAAAVVGRACHQRRISTAGIVLTNPGEHVNDAVLALRPYAMVLAVLEDEQDLLDLLTALRV